MPRKLLAVLAASILALTLPAGATAANTNTTNLLDLSPAAIDQTNVNYRSSITSIVPAMPGVTLQVLDYNDQLVLTNRSGKTITVLGYSGEPYVRILADGTVQVNKASPAYYLNQNFYGDVTVPTSANASFPPQWVTVDKTGSYQWHDHRIHWMSPVLPPRVTNKSKRTFIFNWLVPLQAGTTPVAVHGTLYWVGEAGGGFPAWALISMIVIVVVGLTFGITVQRRRIAREEALHGEEPW